MKFQLKALAAAVALATLSGHALADIKAGNSNTTSQNGELVFFSFGLDVNGNAATYVKDLGVTVDAFVATPSYAAVNLTSDANWTSFQNAAVVGNRYWGVFATQRLTSATSTLANGFSLFTTAANNDVSSVSSLSNTKAGNAFGAANAAIAMINGGGTNYAANNSYFYDFQPVTAATQSGNLGAYLNDDFGTSDVFFSSVNVVGATTTAAFFDVSRGAGTNAAGVPTVANVDATKVWTLNANNELMYAAVPEPETYGLLASGLLLMGAVARRRRG